MGSLASPGIGSGLNVSQLVSQLVAAERAPQERRIARQQSEVQSDLTAFGQVRGVLLGLQVAANALDSSGAVVGRKATVQQGAGFTASATSSAATGRYSIEVESLAAAQKQQSAAFSDTADLGTGAITFTVGSDSYTVTLGATTTLAELRDAINTATGGKGLSATVVKGDAGSVLVLNAATAGTAGAIGVWQHRRFHRRACGHDARDRCRGEGRRRHPHLVEQSPHRPDRRCHPRPLQGRGQHHLFA